MNESPHRAAEQSTPAQRMRQALYADLEPTAARLEFERRRLVSALRFETKALRKPRIELFPVLALSAAATVIAVVATVAVLRPQLRPPAARPEIRLSGQWRMMPSDAVDRGAKLVVGSQSNGELVFPDETKVWLGSGSEVIARTGDRAMVELQRGQALAEVAQHLRGDFRVRTAQVEIIVHGTMFSVRCDGRHTEVRLHEGQVSLVSDGRTASLTPMHKAFVSQDGRIDISSLEQSEALADLRISGKRQTTAEPPRPEITSQEPDSDSGTAEDPRLGKNRQTGPRASASASATDTDEARPSRQFHDPELVGIEVETAYTGP